MSKKEEPVKPKRASYVPYDVMAGMIEHEEGVQGGETSHVEELREVFAWMRGFVNGWYGWANDGKGTFFDFMAVLKAKYAGWKFCCYKPEDMDSVFVDGHAEIKANRIYKNLAWSLTGKTWNKNFAERYFAPRMTEQEENEAMKFITSHFYIIYPETRHYKNLLDDFRFMHEKFGIDCFLIDPWNAVKMDDHQRGDERLVDAFIDVKEFALRTNTVFNIVNHPRSMTDTKVGKGKDSAFKVVDQFMQLGGSAWDMKMDGQYSIYRPERHIDPKDPRVQFYNLKQRQSEVIGVERGCYGRTEDGQSIKFNRQKKQYFFNGVCPMDGSMSPELVKAGGNQADIFSAPKQETKKADDDELPF